MEFITVEQFKEQQKEVQEVFLDWWKSNISEVDLIGYIGKGKAYEECFPSLVRNINIKSFEIGIEIMPLFTEGQLRKFIEDKLNIKAQFSIHFLTLDYVMITDDSDKVWIHTGTDDLLQAYWKVACMIAKEEVDG